MLKKKINNGMKKKMINVFLAVLLAEGVLALILGPVESHFEYVIWTCLYFFPFYFFGLLILAKLLDLKSFLGLKECFERKLTGIFILIFIVLLLIETWMIQSLSQASHLFLSNTLSFALSVFFYLKGITKLGKY